MGEVSFNYHLSACVYLSIYLSIYLPSQLSIYLSIIYLSIYMHMYIYIYAYVHTYIYIMCTYIYICVFNFTPLIEQSQPQINFLILVQAFICLVYPQHQQSLYNISPKSTVPLFSGIIPILNGSVIVYGRLADVFSRKKPWILLISQ